MLELFDLEEEKTWAQVVDKRNEQLGNEARGRLVKMRLESKKDLLLREKEVTGPAESPVAEKKGLDGFPAADTNDKAYDGRD